MADGPVRSRLHALLLRLMPWYDEREADRRDARSQELRLDAIRARVDMENALRTAYRDAGERLRR